MNFNDREVAFTNIDSDMALLERRLAVNRVFRRKDGVEIAASGLARRRSRVSQGYGAAMRIAGESVALRWSRRKRPDLTAGRFGFRRGD
ncbi:hypothetical protein [Neorhizobium galegae]|uniref:hypothetical protein n=1 Tax=Neorhizobium galegae TaxID=399 RepID=UPI000627B650|nr:hypothetical protein [Neorhizobium galegae]